MACLISLPIELWSLIFKFASHKSLLHLCLVCRHFQAEAARSIHTHVQLYNPTDMRWFEYILRYPHQSVQVQTLSFRILHPPVGHIKIIREVLRNLGNLRELDILHSTTMGSEAVEILLGCSLTFRLKTFRNNAFSLRCIMPFIKSQPSITLWEQGDMVLPPTIHLPPSTLPQLQSLRCTLCVLEIIPPLPTILHVKIYDSLNGRDQELKAIHILRRYRKTLQSLVLIRTMTERSLLLEHLVAQVAESTPHLCHFAIRNTGKTGSQTEVSDLAQVLSQLESLKSFKLTAHCDGMGYLSICRAIMCEDGRFRTANALFAACPELCRLGLTYEFSEIESWYARSAVVARCGDTILMRPTSINMCQRQ